MIDIVRQVAKYFKYSSPKFMDKASVYKNKINHLVYNEKVLPSVGHFINHFINIITAMAVPMWGVHLVSNI